jgi:hypothetical protein
MLASAITMPRAKPRNACELDFKCLTCLCAFQSQEQLPYVRTSSEKGAVFGGKTAHWRTWRPLILGVGEENRGLSQVVSLGGGRDIDL